MGVHQKIFAETKKVGTQTARPPMGDQRYFVRQPHWLSVAKLIVRF
jgi:hypothetical protein